MNTTIHLRLKTEKYLELTLEEAKETYEALQNIFGDKFKGNNWPMNIPPLNNPYYVYPLIPPYKITCKTTSVGEAKEEQIEYKLR